MRRCVSTVLLFSAAAILCFASQQAQAITSASNGTFKNDNTGYLRQPSTSGFPISVYQNGNVGVGLGLFYPHSTIVAKDGSITDTQFQSLLTNNLGTGVAQTQDSLIIHMAQCFSGGFVDEVDDSMFRTTINTGAWWGTTSFGSAGNNGHNFYSDAWYKAINAGKGQKDAYAAGVTNDTTHNQELPQYYSTSNTMDAAKLGTATFAGAIDKKYALLFVGDDTNNGAVRRRHYNDALNMYNYLTTTAGYPAANIFTYYVNGAKPAGAPNGLPIDGDATVANFNNFFNTTVKNNVAGQNDQVFVWSADHGGLENEFKGRAKLILGNDNRGKLTVKYKVGSTALSAYANSPDTDATVEVTTSGGMEGFDPGEKLDAVLRDAEGDAFDLGLIDPTDLDLDVPMADLQTFAGHETLADDGEITLELANYNILADGPAFTGDYSNNFLDDVSINFSAFQTEVPEPATITLLALGACLIGLQARRRSRR